MGWMERWKGVIENGMLEVRMEWNGKGGVKALAACSTVSLSLIRAR
jgi:hypothetical protein